jgi:hypothetical protein
MLMSRTVQQAGSWILVAGIALILAGLPGCSPSWKTYPVQGRVTFPDGTPLTHGTVEFESQNPSAKGLNARGEIKRDGSYRLTTFKDGDGAIEGAHRVIVVVPPQFLSQNMAGPPPRLVIDPRFQSYASSGLTCTIVPGDNNYPIRVEKPAGESKP